MQKHVARALINLWFANEHVEGVSAPESIPDDKVLCVPAGQWAGWYCYPDGTKEGTAMDLWFGEGGEVEGSGEDDHGCFSVRGRYDLRLRECCFTKDYVGKHSLHYRAFFAGTDETQREGMWGVWSAGPRGIFRLWRTHTRQTRRRREGEERLAINGAVMFSTHDSDVSIIHTSDV